MNKQGFYLKKLALEGEGLKDAEISFEKGLNVIYGASDTGKTYIYQCIDFMFGASKRPKDIPEARNYTVCKLEIRTYDGGKHYLERNMNGDSIKLKSNDSHEYEVLNANNNKMSKKKTISDFLLSICNITDKKIRKNAKGETRNLYFQGLRRFFLVDETKIITDKSPLFTTQRTGRTGDESTLKFLLTGIDDSDIISTLKKDEITNKKGKIELYEELINNIKVELEGTDFDTIELQITKLDSYINEFRKEYSISNDEFREFNKRKNNLHRKILRTESEILKNNEILKRSIILQDQYTSDISRLRATLEAGKAFNTLEKANCPLCDSIIEIPHESNIEELIASVGKEVDKINRLKLELGNTRKIFIDKSDDLSATLYNLKSEYDEVLLTIKNNLNSKLKSISKQIKIVSNKKEKLSKIKTLKDKVKEYESKRDYIATILKQNTELGKNTKYEKVTQSLLKPIIDNIVLILKAIDFDLVSSVSYSEEHKDFIIGDKNRQDYGKGYRAILYAIYILSLADYLKTMPFQIGLVMIDSPLNPYKPDEKRDSDIVTQDLADNFYRYLSAHSTENQVILIENTPVPHDLTKIIHIKKYIKSNGFIPVPQNLD